MGKADGPENLQALIGEILRELRKSTARLSVSGAIVGNEIEELARCDYGRVLRRSFSRSELRELISEARRRVWPNLNKQPVQTGSPDEFLRRWSATGVQFHLADLTSSDGFALMGFYVGKGAGMKRPLICVNTAHHRVAVSSAFAHEMGHHLVSQAFGREQETLHFLSLTGYREHIDCPEELAADVLVSVGIFPQSIARKQLTETGNVEGRSEKTSHLIRGVESISSRYGLDLRRGDRPENRLQYLAGVVHYTKLRRALFDEYDL